MKSLALAILSACLILNSACGLGPDMTRDRIPPTPTPTPWQGEIPTLEHVRRGDAAAASGDYASAAKAYRDAFEQEKMQQKLDKKELNQLINKLAVAYSRSGDSGNARVVVAYGVGKDYSNPMNSYTLAAIAAEEGSEDEALYHLRNAYEKKKKLPAGEPLPDPMTDSSFTSLQDSDSFKKAVAAMKKR